MSEYTCSICNNKFKYQYFDEEQDKCILHCEKSDTNNWYVLDDRQKNWNKEKINLFWNCIQKGLEEIAANNAEEDTETISNYEFKHIIFPQYQLDYPFHPMFNHVSDLATNFYIYYPYQNEYTGDWSEIHDTIETLKLKFINCTFLDIADFRRYKFKKDVVFFNCTFTNKILLGKTFEHILSFKDCDFKNNKLYLNNKAFADKVVIKQCKNINSIDLRESIFKSKVKIQLCEIKGLANFYNTKFMDLADFYKTKFNNVDFERTDFNQISIFSETQFNEDVDFKYTKFLDKSIFRDTVFRKKLNLRNTIFDDDANFLDMTSKEGTTKAIQVENRETARIIKNSLDSSGNIIEANKFYALEMKERAKELKFNKEPLDWLIFKIHGLASNHSQSWLLTLLWLILLTIISVNRFNIDLNEDIFILSITLPLIIYLSMYVGYFILETILLYVVSIFFFYSNATLTNLAKTFNPFSKLTSNDISMGVIIYKAITAYLIYQFVISIRQNTRRK